MSETHDGAAYQETHLGAAWNPPEPSDKRRGYGPAALEYLEDKHEVSIEPGFHFVFILLTGYWRLVCWGWIPGKKWRRPKRNARNTSQSPEDTETGTRLRVFGAVKKMRGQKSLVLCYRVGDLGFDFTLRASGYLNPWLKVRSSDKSYSSPADPDSFKQPLGGLFTFPDQTITGKDSRLRIKRKVGGDERHTVVENPFIETPWEFRRPEEPFAERTPAFEKPPGESRDEPEPSKADKKADEYAASQVKQALNDDSIYKVAKRVAGKFFKYNWPSGEIDLDDIIQEAALAMLERSGGFDESRGASLRSFRYTCGRSGLSDYWDYIKTTRWFVGFPRGLEGLAEHSETQTHIDPTEDDLNGLPDRQGEVMFRRYSMGQSQAETAAGMGISVSAVQKLQAKGLKNLKEKAA